MLLIKRLYSAMSNKLPLKLQEVLVGYLLGDGGVFYAAKRSRSPRFEFSMGQERLLFAQHMAELFKDYASNALKIVSVKATTNGLPLVSYRFKTQSLPVFKYYRDLFYKVNPSTGRREKIVPQNIVTLLTPSEAGGGPGAPVALAYLIMSDGNYDKGRNRVRIYTNSFTKADVQLLASAINHNFGIYAAVMADTPNQFIITIGANELPKLRSVVAQHMHPSMRYRVGI